MIRKMQETDWEAVAAIYRQSIEKGTATFNTECPEREEWMRAHILECSFVDEQDGRVTGFVTIAHVSARPSHWGVAEVSIYVDEAHLHRGIGSEMLKVLCEESEKQGYWTLYSSICSQNTASIRLHEKCGFRRVGYREKIAKDRFGVWQSTTIMERRNGIV